MSKTIKAKIEEAVLMEKGALEEGFEPVMKVYTFDEAGKINIYVIPTGWPREGKRSFLLELGRHIRSTMPTLDTLLLIADTWAGTVPAEEDDLSKYPKDEQDIVRGIRAGRISMSDLPKKYHHLRSQALMCITHDRTHKGYVVVLPYTRKKKKVTIDYEAMKDMSKVDAVSDNVLSIVWEGYGDPSEKYFT